MKNKFKTCAANAATLVDSVLSLIHISRSSEPHFACSDILVEATAMVSIYTNLVSSLITLFNILCSCPLCWPTLPEVPNISSCLDANMIIICKMLGPLSANIAAAFFWLVLLVHLRRISDLL